MTQDHVATPPKGSGPGIALLHSETEYASGMARLCDTFGEEGYVAVARHIGGEGAPAAAAEAVRALAAHDRRAGGLGIVAFGAAAQAALALAADGRVDVAVLYDPPDAAAFSDALAASPVPVTLHLAAGPRVPETESAPGSDAPFPGFYVYEEAAADFAVPGAAGYSAPAAALAWSRTVAALKRAIGPLYDLEELWAWHLACEFRLQDADAAIATMVDAPYVNHIPTLTGGTGRERLRRFYAEHFVNQVPSDRRAIPISQTVGADRIVDEKIFCFTHDAPLDWMLPGVAPTGRYVEIPLVGIVAFRGDRLVNEHIYWDQASVLVQTGLLDPAGLPVTGREQARKLLDPTLPANGLIPGWED